MTTLITTINKIKNLDESQMRKAHLRLDSLTKPQGSLGKLEDLAKQLVGITAKINPVCKKKVIFTLAADHGITEEGISAFPKKVTEQMVYNFLKGGAGINVLAKHAGAKVMVIDVGVAANIKINHKNFKNKKIAFGTKNFAKEAAMSKKEAIRSITTGFEILEEELHFGIDILGTGEMGIGNTTSSSAITAVFTKKPVELTTGKGTGIDDKTFNHKVAVIKKALLLHKPNPKDALDVLSKVGGFEIGALAGIMLAAAARKIPIVLDGFNSGAAALVAYHLQPKIKNFFIASHQSVERGHTVLLEHLGLQPILNLNLRLGEGTGAALAMPIIEASVKILTEMASFKEARVSERKR